MLHCLDGGGCLGHLWSQEMLLCVMLDGAAGSQRHTPAPPGGSLFPPPHPTPRKSAESTLCNQAATWDVCVWAGEQAQVNEASWQLVGSCEGGTDPETLKRKPHPVDIQSQMENLSLALLMSPL